MTENEVRIDGTTQSHWLEGIVFAASLVLLSINNSLLIPNFLDQALIVRIIFLDKIYPHS